MLHQPLKILTFLLLLVLLFSARPSLAQTSLDAAKVTSQMNDINISLTPENPKIGDTVRALAESTNMDLDRAKITWTLNGKIQKSSFGEKEFSFQVTNNNKITLAVSALGPEGGANSSLLIQPGEIVVIWEASTYVPPFYKGKALAPLGGVFRVIAIPELINSSGKKINSSTLVYRWKKNGTINEKGSGYGKSLLVDYDQTYARPGNTIEVEVYDTANTQYNYGRTYINHENPGLVFYRVDPTLGRMYHKALSSNFSLTGTEVTIEAEPYNVSFHKKSPKLIYNWTVGTTESPVDKSTITLTTSDKESGQVGVNLNIRNSQNEMEGVNNSFNFSFGSAGGSFLNSFGL